MAARYDGAIPLIGIAVGGIAVAAMLVVQGRLGLVAPHGDGDTLAGVTRRYLGAHSNRATQLVLSLAMIGWMGFNVGLGGAGLGAVLGLPQPFGQLLLAAPFALLAFGGMRRWNWLAIVTTCTSVALVVLILTQLAAPGSPVTTEISRGWFIDATVCIGYVAVFALRAPDFSYALARPRDLYASAGLLVGTMMGNALAGVALYRGTGQVDVVTTIATGEAADIGNLLIAMSVVAPSFATLHSGSMALTAFSGWSKRVTTLVVLVVGTGLASLRFDQFLQSWLSVLAVALPSLLVPITVASRYRWRHGKVGKITVWMWLPGSVVGLAVWPFSESLAVLFALLVAGAATFTLRKKLFVAR